MRMQLATSEAEPLRAHAFFQKVVFGGDARSGACTSLPSSGGGGGGGGGGSGEVPNLLASGQQMLPATFTARVT